MKSALVSWSGVLLVAVLVGTGAALAPDALRRVDEFQVTRVVVHGATNIEPDEAVAASGIVTGASLFEDEAAWIDALLEHPLVRAARVERELPATLHLHVVETMPFALVQVPELRVVDARGNVLPIRTDGVDLDLPIVMTRAQVAAREAAAAPRVRPYLRITDEPTLRTLRLLEALDTLDAELFALVSDARPLRAEGVQLALRAPDGLLITLALPLEREQLRALRLTLAHLGAADSASLHAHVDARFRGQIIVAPVTHGQARRMNTGSAG
jgi:hypothetical protein